MWGELPHDEKRREEKKNQKMKKVHPGGSRAPDLQPWGRECCLEARAAFVICDCENLWPYSAALALKVKLKNPSTVGFEPWTLKNDGVGVWSEESQFGTCHTSAPHGVWQPQLLCGGHPKWGVIHKFELRKGTPNRGRTSPICKEWWFSNFSGFAERNDFWTKARLHLILPRSPFYAPKEWL